MPRSWVLYSFVMKIQGDPKSCPLSNDSYVSLWLCICIAARAIYRAIYLNTFHLTGGLTFGTPCINKKQMSTHLVPHSLYMALVSLSLKDWLTLVGSSSKTKWRILMIRTTVLEAFKCISFSLNLEQPGSKWDALCDSSWGILWGSECGWYSSRFKFKLTPVLTINI